MFQLFRESFFCPTNSCRCYGYLIDQIISKLSANNTEFYIQTYHAVSRVKIGDGINLNNIKLINLNISHRE